jgi:ABC-type glutathione transport system ATPase component
MLCSTGPIKHKLRWRSIPAGRSRAGRRQLRQARETGCRAVGCALLNEVESTTLSGLTIRSKAAREIKAICRKAPSLSSSAVRTGPSPSVPMAADLGGTRVKVVDTIGAGDVFNAAFLAALAEGKPLQHCLCRRNCTVASRAISTLPRSYGGPLVAGDHAMSALEIENIRKTYGALETLKGIDIALESGEFLVLLGSSGCGKSTLLNIIAGLADATGGDMRIGNARSSACIRRTATSRWSSSPMRSIRT